MNAGTRLRPANRSGLRPVALLALAGVLCLTATMGSAETIAIRQFVVPNDIYAVFTYTNSLSDPFALPDEQGIYTATLTISDTASLPMEVLITGTVDARWSQRALVTTTLPAGDTSYVETFPLTVTGTLPDEQLPAGARYTATVVHLDVDQNEDFIVTFTNTLVPEPATAALLAASAVSLVYWRKRRRCTTG